MDKKRKGKKKPFAVFLITFVSVFAIGLLALGTVYIMQREGFLEKNVKSVSEMEAGENASDYVGGIGTNKIQTPTNTVVGEEEQKPVYEGKYGEILADTAYMEENNIYAKETANTEEVTIAFAGDINFDDNYTNMTQLKARENGIFDTITEGLMAEMQKADIFMLNNEFQYTMRGEPIPEKQYTFRAKPETANMLLDMGVDIVSLANNHSFDYGEQGILDTFDTLKGVGIPYIGAGKNIEEAMKPVYFIANDIKIAIVSATQIERLDNPDTKEATANSAGVLRTWNAEKFLQVIAEAKENSDFVIAFVHWGAENTIELDWAQLEQAPKYVEAGADLIIGAHPHCLQGIEYVNNVPVVFSLGNFWFNSRALDTGILKASIDQEGLRSLQFVPARQENCTTSLLVDGEKQRVLNDIQAMSKTAHIDTEGYITK